MWTSAVFSLMPVKAEALESTSSFMIMVVLMRINMLYAYAYVKANVTVQGTRRLVGGTLEPMARWFVSSCPEYVSQFFGRG